MAQLGYTKKPLVFTTTRRPTEVITPARPTPYEFKELSDADDHEAVRMLLPVIGFYGNNGGGWGDPAKVMKEAMSKALVPYYPFAGRLREKHGRKLVVECNGEGILFTEATADVTLEDFGDPLHPPFPCLDELLHDGDDAPTAVLDSPLILMQVTKLKCGGFIIAFKVNHTMADGQGMGHLFIAMTELASGAQSPSIQPVWARHLLRARDPPRPTCQHHEFDEIIVDTTKDDTTTTPLDDMVHMSFCFGPDEIAALKRIIPPNLKCSTFEIISACLWRCHTISLRLDPDEMVKMLVIVNARSIFNPPLPLGYYGNVVSTPVALSTAGKISHNPISYTLELVKKEKKKVTQEYMMSFIDLVVLKNRPTITMDHRTFVLSDTTRAQVFGSDFGWGQPKYVGPAVSGIEDMHGGFYSLYKNVKGEKGIVISIRLPKQAMEIFVEELNKLLQGPLKHPLSSISSNLIRSSM